MPKSGQQMLKEFLKQGWIKLRQRGSHVTVGRGNRRAVIPMHKELKKGTEKSLEKELNKDK